MADAHSPRFPMDGTVPEQPRIEPPSSTGGGPHGLSSPHEISHAPFGSLPGSVSGKREALTLFASGLTHDFNNLLVGILTAADLLERDLPEDSDQKPLARLIKKTGERAAHLSRQVLMTTGKCRPQRRPLDVNGVLSECLLLLATEFSSKIRFEYDLGEGLPGIDADPAQFRQAVTSGVRNAAEALGQGGGIVTIRTQLQTMGLTEIRNGHPITPLPPPSGSSVVIEISDTGEGMPLDLQERAFDPFFSTRGKGRGLGLACVLGIMMAHEGGITLASQVGHGTRLKLYWPLPHSCSPPAPPLGTSLPRLLVIDDEPMVRTVVARALQQAGYPILTAEGGREGLELFQAHRGTIQLVLLDVGMPGFDGLETFTELVALQPDINVILTSGTEPSRGRGFPEGLRPTAFLAKPYTVPKLLEVIAGALKLRASPEQE